MKRRILSIITALALCLSLCPAWALAAEGEPDTGLCAHHREHIGCGYAAPTEGRPCGHEHGVECYSEETLCVHVHDETCYRDGLLPAEGEDKAADACVHVCSEESGCVTRTPDCRHAHDGECGYAEADPGAPCAYVCRLCPIEEKIAALPEQVTEDNAEAVRAQLDEILALYRELTEDEQRQLDLSRVLTLQEALDGANDPGNAFESDGFKPVSKLYVLGHEVVNGEVKSGEGWSFADNKLTLDNVNIQASDYPEGVTKFLDRDNNIAREYYLEIYLKGNNTICGVAETGVLSETRNIVLKVTGDPGATLTLDGQFQAELEISGSIGITINTQMPVFFDNGIIVDNGATVTLNCTGTNPSTGYSALSASPGEITIQNGSTLEINTTNPGHTFSLVGFGPLTVDNSTLTIKNAHSSGLALELRQYIFASYAETDTVTIRNSTVNLDAVRGLGGYAVEITDSTINTAERMSLALLSAAGEITVTNSTLNGLAASHFLDKTVPTQYTAYGKARLPSDLTIAAGDTLTVPEGTSLDIPSGVTLTNDGTMRIHGAASLPGAGTLAGTGEFLADVMEDLIHIPQPLYYTGESLMDQISLQDSLTAMEQVFKADTEGWQMTSPPQVVAAGDYTAVFEKANERMSKAFTVSRSGTEFTGEGTAKAYSQDGTETYSFAAGDTITVKAAPTPTGAAPQAAAARLRANPAAGQMAVFVNGKQVSEPVNAVDSIYTMTVSASDVLAAAGGPGAEIPLTAKFVGNGNMADGARTVAVNITAAAKAEKGNTVIGYYGESNLADAFTNDGATVTLLDNVTVTSGLTVKSGQNITFEGRSFTLAQTLPEGETADMTHAALTVEQGGALTVKSGIITSQDSGLNAYQGTLYVEGGEISGGKAGLVYGEGCHISGGKLTGGEYAVFQILSSLDVRSILLNFGNNTAGKHYAYYKNGSPYVPTGAILPSGTFTVQECQHTGVEATDNGDGTHRVNCPYCGYTSANEPHSFDETGLCPDCKLQAAAKVEKSGSETVYVEASGLADVFAEDSGNDGATITLLADVERTADLIIKINCTLDLNGKTVHSKGEYAPALGISSGATVTIRDQSQDHRGQVISEQLNALAVLGTVTLEGGTFTSNGENSHGVYVNSDSASLFVTGEHVTIRNTGGGYGLAVNAVQSVQLSAGTYSGGRAAIKIFDYDANSPTLGDLLAASKEDGTRYAYFDGDTPITGKLGGRELTGTVTVRECGHTGVEVKDLGSGKHGLTCPYCGYHSEHTTTLTATASGNTVTFRGGCASCDYQEEALAAAAFTFPKLTYGQTGQTVSCTWEHPNGYALMVQIDSGEELQIDVSDTQVSLPLEQLFGSQEINAGNYQLHVYCRSYADVTSNVCSLSFTVEKAPLTPSITGTATKPYDGTTAAPEGLEIALTGLVEGDSVTASASFAYNSENVNEANAITATNITLGGADAGNYRLTSDSASIEGTITKADQAAPAAPAATEENIKDTSITLTIIANAEYSKDGTNWQASPTFTGLDPNRAYTFYARLKEDGNHNASPSSTASITTRKMMLDNATVTVGGSYTYTGAAQTPTVAVVKNGKTLTAGTDYTVSYANNTNAGTATVTITGMGDYEGTNSTTFTIQRKTLTVAGAIAAGRPYNGTNTVTITDVTLDGIVGSDAVSVDTADLTGTLNGSNAGSYAAVTLPALTLTGGGADNYTLTRPAGAVSTSVTISKAAARTPKTGNLAVANKQAHTYTFGLGALRPDLPAGMSFGSSAVTYELGAVSLGGYYSGSGAKVEGQTLTLPIEAVESNEAKGIGTITVTIHTGNFQDMTAVINVRSVNKTIPTGAPTLGAATLTYGQPLSTITLSGSMKDGSADVPGAFTWSSPDNRPAVQEKYAAAWTFKPANNEKYAIVTGTALIQVLPAPITGAVITLEPAAFRYDGAAHRPSVAGVTLNGITLTADADYTAEIPEGTEAGSYTVTVTGKGNYTGTAAATFTVNPVAYRPLDQKDGSGRDLRLEVETGLSTVPAALKNDARYDTPKKIETALRTQVEQVLSNVGENIAVFDVTLQYRDESGVWHNVDPGNFPAEGVTAILPYPAGTGATGYTFTVQHLISSGVQAGMMETLSYTLTADGLQCKFLSLSPVAIGYQAAAKPVDPVHPNPGGGSGGGGWSSSTYAVTVEKAEHGKVTANRTNAGRGSTVTLTVTPEDGYVLDTLTVTDSRGNAIKLTAQGNGKYTFTMPGRAVTVKAAFAPLPDGTACDGGANCPSRGFTDLGSVGTWYHEAVDYVLRNNLMGGYGNGLFGPNNTLTRAQFAQILYNKEGRPVVNYLLQFTDVSGEAWYTEAVRWAASQGIVGGYADGRFGPNDNITREQLAVMLWRYAGSPAATDKELHFSDADKIGAYARDALCWAVENGVMNGRSGVLDPKGLATRAQTAQMLKNFFDK